MWKHIWETMILPAFPNVTLTMVKNFGSSYRKRNADDNDDGRLGKQPRKEKSLMDVPDADSYPEPAPAAAASKPSAAELSEEELLKLANEKKLQHIKDISAQAFEPPFYLHCSSELAGATSTGCLYSSIRAITTLL
ncbi:hypothetical protein AAMO2058_001005800 [Amorphochlora amoebiformis]